MKVNFKIEKGVLDIGIVPKRTVPEGLRILHGVPEVTPGSKVALHPAMTRDAEAGRSLYDMPPFEVLDPATIVDIEIDDRALGEFVGGKA